MKLSASFSPESIGIPTHLIVGKRILITEQLDQVCAALSRELRRL